MKSDNELYKELIEKLHDEPGINPDNIVLRVNEGIITISGTVSSFPQRKMVVRAISSIEGVKGIADELQVNLPDTYKRDDAAIAKAAVQALEWNVLVPHDKIQAVVENGRVTLTGEVSHYYQRKSAEKAVRNLVGVTGINNHIYIKTPPATLSPEDVKEKIKKEFERNALIDAQAIKVETSDGKIILQGKVRSWPEYREASRAAWTVPGVTQVDNQLKVSTYLPA